MTPPRTDSGDTRPAAILHLRADPADPDNYGRTPDERLRLLLKHCRRLYGWRCTTLDVPPAAPAEPGEVAR